MPPDRGTILTNVALGKPLGNGGNPPPASRGRANSICESPIFPLLSHYMGRRLVGTALRPPPHSLQINRPTLLPCRNGAVLRRFALPTLAETVSEGDIQGSIGHFCLSVSGLRMYSTVSGREGLVRGLAPRRKKPAAQGAGSEANTAEPSSRKASAGCCAGLSS